MLIITPLPVENLSVPKQTSVTRQVCPPAPAELNHADPRGRIVVQMDRRDRDPALAASAPATSGFRVTNPEELPMTATTTSPPLPRPSPSPAQSSRDPLGNFVEDLDALLHRWNERTGGQWNETILYSFVDEEPLDGYARQRRGPQVNIALTLTDTTRTMN